MYGEVTKVATFDCDGGLISRICKRTLRAESAVMARSTKMEQDKDVKNIRWLQQLCEEPAEIGLTGEDAERFASTLAVILVLHRLGMRHPNDPQGKPLLDTTEKTLIETYRDAVQQEGLQPLIAPRK